MSRLLFFSAVPINDSATIFRSGIVAKKLKEKGYDIRFLSVDTAFNGIKSKNLNGLEVTFIGQAHYFARQNFSSRKRLGVVKITIENFKTCYRFVKIAKNFNPNKVLVITTMPVSLMIGLIARILGFKALIDIEDLAIGQMQASNYPKLLIKVYSILEKNLVKLFNAKIVPSKYLKHRYEKARVIENMIDTGFWRVNKKNYSKQNIKIVFVGNIGKYHGQLEVLQAFSKILKKHKDLKLIFIGGGEYYKKLEGKVKSLKLNKQVFLTGQISQVKVKNILASASFGILPLWDLPVHKARHPLKLLEYLSMGLITVTNNVGEAGRIITNGINGILCLPGDMNCLAYSIEKELKNKKSLSNMKNQAVISARQYSIETILPKWIKIFNE